MSKFYVLRLLNEDQWIAHKGPANTLTSNQRNIHIFTSLTMEARLDHARRVSKLLNKTIVSEDW